MIYQEHTKFLVLSKKLLKCDIPSSRMDKVNAGFLAGTAWDYCLTKSETMQTHNVKKGSVSGFDFFTFLSSIYLPTHVFRTDSLATHL